MPPSFPFQDWHEGGKPLHPSQTYSLPYLPTPVSPFHGEPIQEKFLTAFDWVLSEIKDVEKK